MLSLRSQIEPVHKEIHESATYVLNLMNSNPIQAREYYQTTIQGNIQKLVTLLDQLIDRNTAISADSTAKMQQTIHIMHLTCAVCLTLSLICLIGLILFVMKEASECNTKEKRSQTHKATECDPTHMKCPKDKSHTGKYI